MIEKEVNKLRKSSVRKNVEKRLKEFSSFKDKPSKEWFSELCFCLLTANSKAKTAIAIQKELGSKGFCNGSQKDVCDCIIRNKHRFHNNKSRYIVEARKHLDIKRKISDIVRSKNQEEAREWLVKNIKGLGYKEASHFLRNVGYFDLAILDRHIINLMIEEGLLKEKPKSLSRKVYLDVEGKFADIASRLKMSLAELDMYMWYLKTGEVLK